MFRYIVTKNPSYRLLKNVDTTQKEVIVTLFLTLTNNSSKEIAKIVGVPECIVSEIVSAYLGSKIPSGQIEEPIGSLYEQTEQDLMNVSPVEILIARYNDKCHSAPDFKTRLETIKLLRQC